MAESELYKKGVAIRRRLRGEEDFARNESEYARDPVMKQFIDLATETVFGALWARPGLDIKTRTLICVVSDAATGRHPELDIHLRFAWNLLRAQSPVFRPGSSEPKERV